MRPFYLNLNQFEYLLRLLAMRLRRQAVGSSVSGEFGVKAGLSRRSFLKAGAAGVAIKVSLLPSITQAELIQTPPRPGARAR